MKLKKKIAVVAVILLMSALTGCGQTEFQAVDGEELTIIENPAETENMKIPETPAGGDNMKVIEMPDVVSYDDVVRGSELMCLADSEEEAEKIAADYGIELVRFANGVASFHTDEDLQVVIKRGKDKGLKELSINRFNKAF